METFGQQVKRAWKNFSGKRNKEINSNKMEIDKKK
jgi:hypothetical protein